MFGIQIKILLSAFLLRGFIVESTTNTETLFYKCPVDVCKCDPIHQKATCFNNARRMQTIPNFPSYVKKLILKGDRFPTISRELLKPLAPLHLTQLTIVSSSVYHLNSDCFEDMMHLQTLDLSSNLKLNITSLKISLQSLQEQYINTFRFESMKWNSSSLLKSPFSHLRGKQIILLSLQSNEFNYLPGRSLDGLGNLTALSLAHNALQSCETTLKSLLSLTKIDLSFNKITGCDIKNLPGTIKYLHLTDNKLSEIPTFCSVDSAVLMKELRYLSIDNNDITFVKRTDFSCFPHLQHLSLMGNIIRRFDSYLFADLPLLESLNLNSMKKPVYITEQHAFSIPRLRKFLFADNGYSFQYGKQSSKASFRNCTTLQYLDLSHNSLPLTVENLNYLMGGLDRLLKIRLVNVGWRFIPSSFFKLLPSIEEVDLSHNRISSLNRSNFAKTSRMKILRLDANGIIHIGQSTFTLSFWNTIQRLDLSGNPFACNCELLWFRDKLRKPNGITFLDYPKKYICLSPPNRKDLPLHQFNLTADECKTKSELVVVLLSCASICTFLLMCSVIVYKGRWHLRYWIYLLRYRRSEYIRLNEGECKYDAFIIYAEEDNNFVHDTLLPKLETEHGYRLCIHYRDFVAGRIITDNIAECMSESRHVVVIVSENFCKSKWCKFELTIAQDRWLNNESEAPVLAMLEEVQCKNMTRDMRALVKTTTYVLWTENQQGQALFWDQLLSVLKK